MILLRRVIGDALRARRQSQHRTLREVSTAANVSLGYLSEIERGQKEASSELLAAICDALGAQLSELLREVSYTVAVAERAPDTRGAIPTGQPMVPVQPPFAPADARMTPAAQARRLAEAAADAARPRLAATAGDGAELQAATATGIMLPKGANARPGRALAVDGEVAVSVHQSGPLKATLRTTRNTRSSKRGRDVVCAV